MSGPASTLLTPRFQTPAPAAASQSRLEVRIARGEEEVRAAQALRYRVFYEEMGALPAAAMPPGWDVDPYDRLCDHLLAIDHEDGAAQVIGTYRLLRQDVAAQGGGFYSAGEYDLGNLLTRCPLHDGGQLLELGRSCVAREHRNAATIALLWRGIASYLEEHGIRYMFGCASLPGADPQVHEAALSYLAQYHLAPEPLRVRALARHYVPMERIAQGEYDRVATSRLLPPLLKGYLRVGAMVGDGAFIDRQFNTVDVFVLMPVDKIASRYAARFQAAA